MIALLVAAILQGGAFGDHAPQRIWPSLRDDVDRLLAAPEEDGQDVRAPGKSFFGDIADTGWTLGKTFVLDTGYLAATPLRATRDGFFQFLGGIGIVGVAMVLDDPIRGFVLRNQHEDFRHVVDLAEAATSRPFATGAGVTALGLILEDPRVARTGLEIVETDMFVRLLTDLGKRVFGRSRPFAERGPHAFHFMGGTHNSVRSFPSDAAASAFSIAVPLAEEYPGTVWPWATYALATLAAVSRLEADAHWTSDVLTSALLSLAVGKALVWLHSQQPYPPLVPWLATDDGDQVAGVALAMRF